MDKKFTAIILVFGLLLSVSYSQSINGVVASEEKPYMVAVGDSIAYGMSAKDNKGYAYMAYEYLKNNEPEYRNLIFKNYGTKGDKTSDLLNKLNAATGDKAIQNDIAKAKIITISIGANNLLAPIVDAYRNGIQMPDLTINGELIPGRIYTWDEINTLEICQTKEFQEELDKVLKKIISTGVFSGYLTAVYDWPRIIDRIMELNSEAKIYVLNLYNPLRQINEFEKKYYLSLNTFIMNVNGAIENYSTDNAKGIIRYEVIRADDICRFAADLGEWVEFDIYSASPDPHPTDAGHQIFADAMISLVLKRSFYGISGINIHSGQSGMIIANFNITSLKKDLNLAEPVSIIVVAKNKTKDTRQFKIVTESLKGLETKRVEVIFDNIEVNDNVEYSVFVWENFRTIKPLMTNKILNQ